MNHTTNYSLPQWEDSDRVTREDVNSAMSSIDTAMAGLGNCKIVCGVYRGYGESGIGKRVTLSFDGNPALIAVFPRQPEFNTRHFLLAVRGTLQSYTVEGMTNGYALFEWNNDSVSFWSILNDQPAVQMNTNNGIYFYVALLT